MTKIQSKDATLYDLQNDDGTLAGAVRNILNLGSAADAETSSFATAAQGAKADSAVQPADLSVVATTGVYSDLTGKPTLGTAAAQDSTAFATAAQGALADTALQPADIGSTVQGYDAGLQVIGGLAATDGNFVVGNGITWTVESGATARTSLGLGTSATQDTTAFATAAQGTLADTSLQPDDIGVSVQAYDADLSAIGALAKADGNFVVGNGTTWVAESGATARTSLGLGTAATQNTTAFATAAQGALADTALQPAAIGSTVQAHDAGLASIAGLTTSADKMIYTTASDTYATATLTSVGRALLDDTTTAAQRTTLGLNGSIRYFADEAALLAGSAPDDTIYVGNVIMQYNVSGPFADSTGRTFAPALYVTPRMFGAVGNGMTDDKVAIQEAWDYSGTNKIPCLMEGLEYNCSEAVYTISDLRVHAGGAVMYPTSWPAVGGFINNVRPVAAERQQSNIHISDLITDGRKVPHYFVNRGFPQQTENLLASQSNFDQAGWTKTGVTVTMNAATAPDGTVTAEKVTEDTSTGSHVLTQTTSASVASGEMVVFCVYVRTPSARTVNLSLSGNAFSSTFRAAAFDLAANEVLSKSAGVYAAEVQDAGNGWSLVTIAVQASATGTYTVGLYMSDAAGSRSYTGNGGSYISAWGAFSNVAAASNNMNLGPEFAWGASHIRIINCVARNCRVGRGGGPGGGGFGGELGLKDVQFIGCTAENCHRGIRIAGNLVDTLSTGATEEAINLVFRDLTVRRCQCAIFAHSVAHTGDDESNLKAFDALFDGVYIEDCGHSAWVPVDWVLRSAIGGPQKAGIIALGGAQNVRFRNMRIVLTDTYATTAVDWLGRAGYPDAEWNTGEYGYFGAGLSGKVESVIGGWGQNVRFDEVELDGTVTYAFKIHRVNVFGDIGSVPPTSPTNETCRQISIHRFRHIRGTQLDYVFGVQSGVDNADCSIRITDFTRWSAFASGVIDAAAAAGSFTNVWIDFLDNNGSRQSGTAAEWNTYGNAPAASPQKMLSLGGLDLAGGYNPSGTRFGISYNSADGLLRSSQNATSAKYMQAYYNPNGLVGSIQTSASATTFATTSDETLKDFTGEYEWENAYAVIKADPVRTFNWKKTGEGAIGWGAQTSYSVSTDLATPGGWFGPDGEPCAPDTEGAEYMPWGVDKGSRTPYLWAAFAHMIDEVDALKAELSALKSKLE